MIRGYFLTRAGRRRPFITATIELPAFGRSLGVRLLVDTGADRTVLAPRDAGRLSRLGVDLEMLPTGRPSTGVGGVTQTRTISAVLTLGAASIALTLPILEPPAGQAAVVFPMPSLLGRDILSRFALFVEERTGRVLLLEPHEADALALP
ncbi:MAG: retropepsin-like aspartic protease [Chloroflexota bacterium]